MNFRSEAINSRVSSASPLAENGSATMSASSSGKSGAQSIRKLGGKRWQRLHNIIYGIGLLVLIHYFQQTKADVSVPTFVAGLFGLMIGYRALIKFRDTRDEPPTWMLLALSVGIAALTFLCEAIGIGIVFNVSPLRVLENAFDVYDLESIRPGWLVLGAGLIVTAIDALRARMAPRRPAAAARSR